VKDSREEDLRGGGHRSGAAARVFFGGSGLGSDSGLGELVIYQNFTILGLSTQNVLYISKRYLAKTESKIRIEQDPNRSWSRSVQSLGRRYPPVNT
jgi:hypothetical protein